MTPAVIVTLILVIGVALVVAAILADRRSAIRASGQTSKRPPTRPVVPDESLEPPAYITSHQLLAQAPAAVRLGPDQEREIAAQLTSESTVKIQCRLGAPTLATHTGVRAILDQPAVLVCSDPIGQFRELLTLLAGAAADKVPLVIAAPAIDADTLQTLIANKLAGTADVAVVLGDETALAELASASNSVATRLVERQAGEVSLRMLGRPERIVASPDATWVILRA